MKCYTHRGSDAVGVCWQCGRGLCGGCARDFEPGLACSDACAAKLTAPVESPARSFAPPSFEAIAAREGVVAEPAQAPGPRRRFAPPSFESVKPRDSVRNQPHRSARHFEPPRYEAIEARAVIQAPRSPTLFERALDWKIRPVKALMLVAAATSLAIIGAVAMS